MNLVDQLLKADAKKADELSEDIFQSKKLARVLESKEDTVDIKIREVPSRRMNDIIAYQVDRKGQFDYSKSFDAKLMMCIEGIVDPDMRNKDLQAHFKATNAKELAEKLFGMEINEISDAITVLAGISTGNEDTEEEIKN